MILTVTLNPSVDHALFIDELRLNETNRVQHTERDAGGKGVNLARVYAELGGDALATGFLGGGPGAYIRKVLDQQGVLHEFVEVEGDTRINFSVEDQSGKPPTTFNAKGAPVTESELEELLDKVRKKTSQMEWIAVGGSVPPGVPSDIYKTIGEIVIAGGARFVLDADGDALKYGIEAKPHLIKPNESEAERFLGIKIESQDAAADAAKQMLDKIDREDALVVLSLGSDGAILASHNGVFAGITPRVETKSTIGSGDSMVAGILWALNGGKSMEEALRWGLAAGAATATTDGSEIARRSMVRDLFMQATVRGI